MAVGIRVHLLVRKVRAERMAVLKSSSWLKLGEARLRVTGEGVRAG